MPVFSLAELRAAVDNDAFDQLLGTPESSWLEFKAQPYALTTPRGSWELSKDVAALANASGGVIVIGVRTVEAEGSNLDVASELRPMPAGLANHEQYRHVLAAGVFPVPEDIVLSSPVVDGDKQLLVIEVPAQPEQSRPFLVRYLVDHADRRLAGFGWPVRSGDRVVWQSCEQFQSLLNLEGSIRRLVVGGGLPAGRPASPVAADWAARAAAVRQRIDSTAPALVLQAAPRQQIDLTRAMYGDRGIVGALRSRRPLRKDGFNLKPSLNEDVRGPLGVEFGSRWRTAVDHNGLVTAVVPAHTGALTWEMGRRGDEAAISTLFLTEWVNDYFSMLYKVVLPLAGVAHQGWTGLVRGVEMKTGDIRLPMGWPRYVHDDEVDRATSDEFERAFDLSGDPDADTFVAMSLLYALFGRSPDDIPFCRDGRFSPSDFLGAARR